MCTEALWSRYEVTRGGSSGGWRRVGFAVRNVGVCWRAGGHAVERVVRGESGVGWRVRPRRARCRSCLITHVLLPTRCLLRRGCETAVVFAALGMRAAGRKLAAIAAALGVPASTVRDWIARCVSRAERLRSAFLRLVPVLDPHAPPVEPAGSVLGDALAAVGAAAEAAGVFGRRLRAVSPGELASHLSRGMLPGFRS